VPFIIQSLIMLGIIIAMNFSVTQLRAMVSNSPWVPSTPLQVRSRCCPHTLCSLALRL
jgi:hypothetical protein